MHMVHTPKAVFRSVANQNINWRDALAELIDNSFDAGASRVEVGIINRMLEIRDDGRGCKDIANMLPLGSHYDQGAVGQTVGTYGVGLKDAWMFCGDEIEIDTVHAGVRGTICLAVSDIDDNWETHDPIYSPTSEAPGTTIRLPLKRHREPPRQNTWDYLAWVFEPALVSQRQIVVKSASNRRKLLAPVKLPPMIESVESSFDVDGRPVKIEIGIIKEGHKRAQCPGPFWMSYGHRNISGSSLGAKSYSTMRMCGRIELGRGWVLKKNKNDLSELKEELEDAIHERIAAILEKHSELAEDIESIALRNELEMMLNKSIATIRREKRESASNHTGAVVPNQTGRKRTHATKTQQGNGSVLDDQDSGVAKKKHGFRFTWDELNEDLVGEYDTTTKTVRLNVSHPFIAQAKAESNRPALHLAAVATMAHVLVTTDKNNNLLAFDANGSFDVTYGTIMRTIAYTTNGESNG